MVKLSRGRQASSSQQGAPSGHSAKAGLDLLLDLHCSVLLDVADALDYNDALKDIETITFRCRHEGFAFLSKSLPVLGDSFTKSLSSGLFSGPTSFKNGTCDGQKSPLPALLQGLIARVFDNKTGILLKDPDYTAVWAVRQIALMFKKYEVPLSSEIVERDLLEMLKVDEDGLRYPFLTFVLTPDGQPDTKRELLCQITDKAYELLAQVFEDTGFENIVPRHGPGATADKLKQHEKYRFQYYHRDLDGHWPRSTYCVPSLAQALHQVAGYFEKNQPTPGGSSDIDSEGEGLLESKDPKKGTRLEPVSSELSSLDSELVGQISQVCSVPKTSTKSRIISEESASRQWIQQGIAREMVERAKWSPLTRGQIHFKDQTVNQRLALEGSESGKWATIDWSSASDRIYRSVCKALLQPRVFHALDAARSAYIHIDWPDGTRTTRLTNKMAPMGNGFTFPLETLIFWALSSAAIAVCHQIDLVKASSLVYVFGDDTIVPTEYAQTVMTQLKGFGFVPNEDKSFWRGSFRESCGMDAFQGVDVSILRIKTPYPLNKKDASGLTSWTDYANEAIRLGLGCCATKIIRHVESRLGEPLPMTPYQTELLSLIDPLMDISDGIQEDMPVSTERSYYCGYTIKGYKVKVKTFKPDESGFTDEDAWLRWVSYVPNPDTFDRYSKTTHQQVARKTGSMRGFAVQNSQMLSRGRTTVS